MDLEEDDSWVFDGDLLEPDELELIKQTIAGNYERYAAWACLAALGLEHPDVDNPLLVRREGKAVPLAPIYTDVAWMLLEKITGKPRRREKTFEGYWSIADWIAYKVKDPHELEPRELERVSPENYQGDVDRAWLVRDFFLVHLDLFEYLARSALVLVYHGVPLYRPTNDGAAMEMLPFADPDYLYLFKKGEYFDRVDVEAFPFWASAYYFKVEHLELERRMFNEAAMDLSAQAIAALREGYRRVIGVEPAVDAAPAPVKHQSSLLALIPKVLERYYGPSYVTTDPDTWTKQTTVIKWLMSTFKISEREAGAIDVVTRPDYARRKSR